MSHAAEAGAVPVDLARLRVECTLLLGLLLECGSSFGSICVRGGFVVRSYFFAGIVAWRLLGSRGLDCGRLSLRLLGLLSACLRPLLGQLALLLYYPVDRRLVGLREGGRDRYRVVWASSAPAWTPGEAWRSMDR